MKSPSFYYRGGIALLSAIAGLVTFYLHWLKMRPAVANDPFDLCSAAGDCALVQNSAWSWFMGVDVALIGAVGNAAIFLVAAIGMTSRRVRARWPTVALMALIYPAAVFVAWLKYGEFFILRSFCPWCAVPTIAIALCVVLVTLDARHHRAGHELPGQGMNQPLA